MFQRGEQSERDNKFVVIAPLHAALHKKLVEARTQDNL